MDDHKILEEITLNQWLIPNWLKSSIQQSLITGDKIFSSKELKNFIQQDINKFFNQEIYSNDYNLSSDEIRKIHQVSSLGESLFHISLRLTYGWGMPCEESIHSISSHFNQSPASTLIEIGAGSGIWSALLQARTSKKIIPCELNLRMDTPRPTFCDVINLDANIILKENPHSDVLIVWPDTTSDIHLLLENISPNSFLFLAGPPDVTGNLKFFKELDSEFTLQGSIKSCNFTGTEDLFILQKTPPLVNHHFFENYIKSNKPVFKLKKNR